MAHSVKVLQMISNSSQKYVPHDTTTTLTRILQHAPAQTVPFQQAQVGRGAQGFHIGSSLPSVAPSAAISSDAPPPAVWDEQLGQSFTQDFTSLAYNVTAVEQADVNGYGPAYLLNGLSGSGYWYQVGLSWDWPYVSGGYNSGFYLNYEVFNSNGSSIFPSSSGGGLDNFSMAVNQGDTVLLSLYFSSGNVTMYGYDYNTGASAQESYSAEGATDFTGTPYATSNLNGFFTGLMTEWYHVSEYYGNEASVRYSNSTFALSSAWMWIDEWYPYNSTTLFSASTLYPVSYSNSTQLQYFSSNGATEASDAYDFITGTANLVPITLSYSIVGGGTGYGPPTLTYSLGDAQYVATLTTSPTTYYIDPSSVWNASNPLSGSSSTETWSSNQQTSNVANSSQTINIVYFHQYLVNLGYNVLGTGVGYSPPNVTIEQFGGMYAVTTPTSVFVDAGSQCLYPNPLLGSNSTTVWESPSTTVTVSSPTTIIQTYYLQYNFTVSYSISGGSGYSAPFLHGTQFGSVYAPSLTTTPTTYWLDSGTSWSVDNTLSGSGNSERWITTATTTSGTVSLPITLVLSYHDQWNLTVYYILVGGGKPVAPTFSYTQYGVSGQTYTMTQGASSIWVDAGTSWSVGPNPLTPSSSAERWDTQSLFSGTVSAASTINPTYYHQYLVVYSYSIEGGGNPTSPALNGTSLGASVRLFLGMAPASVWLDSGTNYSFDSLLNASMTERWITNQPSTSGTMSSPATFSPVYVHQFYVDMESNAATGGSISPTSYWFNAGQQIQISAVPNSGWQFENWSGSGTGSYSGVLNSTIVTINSPTVEYATFYLRLTLNITSYGTVTYSYGSAFGSVPSGSSEVLYVPLNANVSLTANPSFYIFRFKQWSGAANSTAQQIQITVTAPTVLRANFDFDWVNIAVTIVVVAIGLAALAILILRRSGTQTHDSADQIRSSACCQLLMLRCARASMRA